MLAFFDGFPERLSSWPPSAVLSTVAAAAVVLVVALWPRYDFVIRVRDGQVDFRGKVPLAHRPAISQFLLQDLAPRGPIQIKGARVGKRLRLRFHGDLHEGERQRVRNFLAIHV